MKKIAILAFQARAQDGTESGLAWQWANAYKRRGFKVTVVSHSDPEALDDEIWATQGIELIRLGQGVGQKAPGSLGTFLRSWRAYSSWRELVESFLMQMQPDLVHHVSWGSVRLPPADSCSDVPFVWGPLGGGQHAHFAGLKTRDIPIELLRSIAFPYTLHTVRKVLSKRKGSIFALSTNHETSRRLQKLGLHHETLLADGLDPKALAALPRTDVRNPGSLNLLWAGRLVGTKRPDLALRVVRNLVDREFDVRLVVLGDGPEMKRLRSLAADLSIEERVDLRGRVPWTEMDDYYDRADVYLFHSMRDSSCPSVLEAAARAIPTVAFRIQGVDACVPAQVARGPKRMISVSSLSWDLADACISLMKANEYSQASKSALEFAKGETWDTKLVKLFDAISFGAP